VFFGKNAISKNVEGKTCYLPKTGKLVIPVFEGEKAF
jgi:hypothetical protein